MLRLTMTALTTRRPIRYRMLGHRPTFEAYTAGICCQVLVYKAIRTQGIFELSDPTD